MEIRVSRRAVLTILDEPIRMVGKGLSGEAQKLRSEWIKRLSTAIELSLDEELPDLQRQMCIRKPIDLTE